MCVCRNWGRASGAVGDWAVAGWDYRSLVLISQGASVIIVALRKSWYSAVIYCTLHSLPCCWLTWWYFKLYGVHSSTPISRVSMRFIFSPREYPPRAGSFPTRKLRDFMNKSRMYFAPCMQFVLFLWIRPCIVVTPFSLLHFPSFLTLIGYARVELDLYVIYALRNNTGWPIYLFFYLFFSICVNQLERHGHIFFMVSLMDVLKC